MLIIVICPCLGLAPGKLMFFGNVGTPGIVNFCSKLLGWYCGETFSQCVGKQ